MFPADAQFQAWMFFAADPCSKSHKPSDAWAVDRLKRRAVENLALDVGRHELRFGVVAGEAKRGLGEVVGAEREEIRVAGDAVGDEAGPRQLDDGPDGVVLALL